MQLFLSSALIVMTVILNRAMPEQKKWVYELEFARFGIMMIYIDT